MKQLPITVAVFGSKFDNAVVNVSHTDWYSWAPNFVRYYSAEGCPETESKDDLAAVVIGEWDLSPTATRRQDGKVQRRQENFKAFHVLTLDIEQREGQEPISFETVRSALNGLEHVGFTTFSHLLPGKGERYRILLPLRTPLPTETLERLARPTTSAEVWEGPLPDLFPFCDHKATWKRLQIAYLPGAQDPSNFKVWHEEGELFDWTALELLRSRPPYAAPVERNTSRSNSGRPVLHTMDLFEWFEDYGLIKRGTRGDRTVQVSCPNSGAHTGGLDDGAALLLEVETGRYGFCCQHSHCGHLNGHNFKVHVQQHDPTWADYCEKKQQVPDLATQLKAMREERRALNRQP